MKIMNMIVLALVLFAFAGFAEVADLSIENERVEGTVFKFEISIQRGDAWAGDGLGHADFYFDYNDAGLADGISATNLHPALDGNSAYAISASVNGGLLHVKIDYTNGAGMDWLPGLNLAEIICTVEMDIVDASLMSGLEWDVLNTGILTANISSVDETFQGSGDISLPVELTSFEGRYLNGVVELTWQTQSEFQNWGFFVYRSTSEQGAFERVNSTIIKGAGSSTMPNVYKFVDERVSENTTYFYALENVDMNGVAERTTPIRVQTGSTTVATIDDYVLEQNYPNPFNPLTTITFSLAQDDDIDLSIYTIDGRLVRRLAAGKFSVGSHSVVWDGLNQSGEQAPSGSYVYQLKSKNFQQSKKLTLLH